MSLHDKLAQKAISMGKSAATFNTAAQKHANASVIYFIVGGIVWYFFGWKWALIPFGLGLYAGFQSVSSTLIATRLEKFEQNSETPEDDLIKIVSAYGKVMETSAPALGTVADATKLPYPKQQIKDALIDVLRSTDDPQMKESIKIGYFMLANWQEGVGDNNIGLDLSKVDPEQDTETLAKQILDKSEGWIAVVDKEKKVLKQEWDRINQ